MQISFNHRNIIHAALLLLIGNAAVAPAWSQTQTWPSKPIRIVAPFPPGGFTDVVTRRVAAMMATDLGQAVIVENRAGAGTNIGTAAVVQSPADGHTLLMGTSSLAINRTLYSKLAFDAERDLTPIGMVATTGYTLIANPSLPASDASQLIALSKASPGSLSFGSSGNGAVNHLAGARFASMAGVDIQHVPYKGSQAAITDLIGGRIHLFWASNLEAIPMIKAGRVKALGVTTASVVPVLPNVQPIGQTVKGYDVVFWMGLYAPAKTPQPVLDRLTVAVQKASLSPEIRQAMEEAGADALFRSPSQAKELLKRDSTAWGKVVRDSGATVE